MSSPAISKSCKTAACRGSEPRAVAHPAGKPRAGRGAAPGRPIRGREGLESKLAAEELALAARIHAQLMSAQWPHTEFAELHARTLPCMSIGGDFFDVVGFDNCVYAVVADVCGKGVSAALVAAALQGVLHSQMQAGQPLARIAATVNQFLYSRSIGKFVTFVLVKLCKTGELEYLNCGHVLPILIQGGSFRKLSESNIVAGLFPTVEFRSATCRLFREDRIVIVTDGITEAENEAGEQFGESGLQEALGMPTVDAVFDRLLEFQATSERDDDWTALELRFRAPTNRGLHSAASERY